MRKRGNWLLISMVFVALVFSGCSSGGGGSSSSSTTPRASSSSSSSSGGSSSGGGGGGGGGGGTTVIGTAANHPLAGASIQYNHPTNGWTELTTTDANAAYSFTPSTLSGVTYPAVLRIPANSGTIRGTTTKYGTELQTILERAPAAGNSVYFSLFTTMVAKLYTNIKSSYATPAAAVAAAKSKVKGLIAAFGVSFDPMTANPMTNSKCALLQNALWLGFNVEPDAYGSSTTIGNMINSLVSKTSGLGQNNPNVLTVVKNALPKVAASVTAAGNNNGNGLKNFMSSVKSNAAVRTSMENCYPDGDSFYTELENEAYDDDLMGGSIGFVGFKSTTVGSAQNGVITTQWEPNIFISSAADGTAMTVTMALEDLEGNALDTAATISYSTSDLDEIGTVSAMPATSTGTTFTFTFTPEATPPADSTGYIEFTITPAEGEPATCYLDFSVYDNTKNVPTSLSLTAVTGGNADRLLVMAENQNPPYTDGNQYVITATVKNKGQASNFDGSEYNVNFYAPLGTVFYKGPDDNSENYMVAIGCTDSVDCDTAGQTATLTGVKFRSEEGEEMEPGDVGPVEAYVWKIDDDEEAWPLVLDTTSPFWVYNASAAQVTAGTDRAQVRRLELVIKDGTDWAYDKEFTVPVKTTGDTGTMINLTGTSVLQLNIVTWGMDSEIDAVNEGAYTLAGSGLSDKYLKLFTDNPKMAGVGFTSGTTGNLPLGKLVLNDDNVPIANANFGGLSSDTPLTYSAWQNATDNMDSLHIEVFDDGNYDDEGNLPSDSVTLIFEAPGS